MEIPIMKNKADQFFDEAAGFLEAIQRIIAGGFFSEFNVSFNNYDGNPNIFIKATGYIPGGDEEKAYGAKRYPESPGVVPYVNIPEMLAAIRQQLKTNDATLENCHCEVKTGSWAQSDKSEEKTIGSHGLQYELSLSLSLKKRKRRK